MFNALASLAQRHGKRTVIFAAVFFVIAGALGGGVASKLAPYGADDPATESVKAADRLEADGYRDPSVIVLFQKTSPDLAGRAQRIRESSDQLRCGPGRRLGHRLPRDAIRRLRLPRRQRDLPRGQPEADRRQGTAGRRQDDRRRPARGQPGVEVGGTALAQEQVNKQVEKDLRTRRAARLPAALPALAALLPQPRRRAAAAAGRRAGDRRHLPDAARSPPSSARSRSSPST